jgi:D-amino-acid dehydrogenase
MLLQKDSPLMVRARFDPNLWSWMLRFALRCNRGSMLESARGIGALLNSSRSLYDDLLSSGKLDAEWQTRGLLLVFRTPTEMDHHAETDRLLSERFSMPARRYDGQELCEVEPALKPGLAGAWHYESDAHLRPDMLLRSWRGSLESMGVVIHERCSLSGIERQGRRVTAVVTEQGSFPADHVVIATGAWTPRLNRHLGCSVPIQPGKGYSITMARPARCPVFPLLFDEDRVAVTPLPSAYRLGSTMEFAGYDERLNESRLEILRRAARRYLIEPEAEPVLERWWGWRPMVPDGLPIIGAVPGRDNLYLATGHGMLGLSMAAGTGRLVAELISGSAPHVDPRPYRVGRF